MPERTRGAEHMECSECRRIWDELAEARVQAFALQGRLETARLSQNIASELLLLPQVRDNAEDCMLLERLLELHEQDTHPPNQSASAGHLATRSAVVR